VHLLGAGHLCGAGHLYHFLKKMAKFISLSAAGLGELLLCLSIEGQEKVVLEVNMAQCIPHE